MAGVCTFRYAAEDDDHELTRPNKIDIKEEEIDDSVSRLENAFENLQQKVGQVGTPGSG